ncbi:rod shape-determining protein MreC [Tenacibaculum maritimum]|uniref:rod shape-determining protein MreC n=1 Tax=Tenacibaculum maritimum TaxID=107401 RepID=UPI001E48F885|nr:rod shape-determining protein MreC [Tenacibaculum maritimum]MCD9563596.1 rod shape-determining protein MreC [Tenacibaculum maritimum]MCD9566858.1 rod shape-determining protein MreC [Tenacibaculum maritimum]MCD9580079.1 rod shape-determining protein MreC [Tenacibaculum maritimum]MCD9597601.1 rod shape-determining protein MreC [Tenacibaculum maritimum]MCD9614693.1 rod shape-determining protein MreC [Tenacibaculum maritimum]
MQQLVYFFQKYKNFLFFIFLEIIAVALTINNHTFHKSKFINSANFITGGLYQRYANLASYLSLKAENEELVDENITLRRLLEKVRFSNDSTNNFTHIDTLLYHQKYDYINAKIINNNYHAPYNFITINKGKNANVSKEMAVINSKGIIGITDAVSNNYARVRSILNKNSNINARLKNSTHFGTLKWNGNNYNIVQLTDIPRQASFKVGDTIITGGKSTIFPEGIPIGTILNVPLQNTASNTLDIKLFNDMSNLYNIYIISNLHKNEIKILENTTSE